MSRFFRTIKYTYRSINFTRITVRAIVIFFFASMSFMCLNWRDTGQISGNPISNFLADIFVVFQFPVFFIFYNFFEKMGYYSWSTYFVWLGINAYFYSLIIEFIYFLFHKIFRPTKSNKYRRLGLRFFIIGFILILIAELYPFAKVNLPSKADIFGNPNIETYSLLQSVFTYSGLVMLVFGIIFIAFNPAKTLKEISAK